MPRRPRPTILLGISAVIVAMAAGFVSAGNHGTRAPAPQLLADDFTDEPTGDHDDLTYSSLPDGRSLTHAAIARARAIALEHSEVRAWIAGGRTRIVLVRDHGPFEPDDVPVGDPCIDVACIDVTLYSYDTDRLLDVFVDPARAQVLRLEPGRGQPPLSLAERRRAHRLAERDQRVRALVGTRRHGHPAVLAKPMWPSGTCNRHRCATVIFTFGNVSETGIGRTLNVLVDLSAERVLDRTRIRCTPTCRWGWQR